MAKAKQDTAAPVTAEEMREDAAPPKDKLVILRAEVAKLRDLKLELADLEERTADVKARIREIETRTLVDLFDDADVNICGVPAIGNAPPFEVTLADIHHANIPEESKKAAFAYLNKSGNGDLIKTTFTIAFGMGEAKATERFMRSLDKANIPYSAKQGVPWNSLTAWFKAEHKRRPLSPTTMGILGASITRVANVVKPKKEK